MGLNTLTTRWLRATAAVVAAVGAAAAVLVAGQSPQPSGVDGSWELLFEDEFDGRALQSDRWADHEPWQGDGFSTSDAWYPVPHSKNELEISDGKATLKARRGSKLPEGKPLTSVDLNTRGKFSIPAGVTSFTEARLNAPTGRGLLPAFWLLGDGTNDTGEGWPINGEIDILEFANNVDEVDRPYASVWYPKDVYTSPPGTFLNGTHDTHPDSFAPEPGLKGTWHTWGLFRSPERMDVYIDGVRRFTFLPGEKYKQGTPLPQMLFERPAHVRLSLGVGGEWAGAGRDFSEYDEGELQVDYVRSWQIDR